MDIKSWNWTRIMAWIGSILGVALTTGYVSYGPISELRDNYRDRGASLGAVVKQQSVAGSERLAIERRILAIEPRLTVIENSQRELLSQIAQTRNDAIVERENFVTKDEIMELQQETQDKIEKIEDRVRRIETDVAVSGVTVQQIDKKVDMVLEAIVSTTPTESDPNANR